MRRASLLQLTSAHRSTSLITRLRTTAASRPWSQALAPCAAAASLPPLQARDATRSLLIADVGRTAVEAMAPPWSAEDNAALEAAVRHVGRYGWPAVEVLVPGRSRSSCSVQWPKLCAERPELKALEILDLDGHKFSKDSW